MKTHTTDNAAAILKISIRRVQQLAKSRGLTKRGRDWIFDDADLEKLKDRRNGRPKKAPEKSE